MPLGRMTIFQQKWKINTIMNFGRSVIKKMDFFWLSLLRAITLDCTRENH